jgi:hypothetical protein
MPERASPPELIQVATTFARRAVRRCSDGKYFLTDFIFPAFFTESARCRHPGGRLAARSAGLSRRFGMFSGSFFRGGNRRLTNAPSRRAGGSKESKSERGKICNWAHDRIVSDFSLKPGFDGVGLIEKRPERFQRLFSNHETAKAVRRFLIWPGTRLKPSVNESMVCKTWWHALIPNSITCTSVFSADSV